MEQTNQQTAQEPALLKKTKIVGLLLIFFGIFFLFMAYVFSHGLSKDYAKYGIFLFLTLCILSFLFSYHILKKKKQVGWGVFSLLLIDIILGALIFFLIILGFISLVRSAPLDSEAIVLLPWLLLPILLYVYTGFILKTIAKKTNTEDGWLAWIPVINLYLLCRIARKPGWWVILLFIPFLVNVIIFIILWMRIAEIRNKPAWLGVLMILPIINFVIAGILAFSDKDESKIKEITQA